MPGVTVAGDALACGSGGCAEGGAGTLGVPGQPELVEPSRGRLDQVVIPPGDAEGAPAERLDQGGRHQERRRLGLDRRHLPEGEQDVEPGGRGRDPVVVLGRRRDRRRDEATGGVEVAPPECEPCSDRVEHRFVALHRQRLGHAFQPPGLLVVSELGGGQRTGQQGTLVAHAGGRQVVDDRPFGPLGERQEVRPLAAQLGQLDEHRHGVEPVVRRELDRDLVVEPGEPPRLGQHPQRHVAGDRRAVQVLEMIEVVDPVGEARPPLPPSVRGDIVAGGESAQGAGIERVRQQGRVVEPLGDGDRLLRCVAGIEGMPVGRGDQRDGPGARARLGEGERLLDPAVDELAARHPLPDRPTERGLEGELGVDRPARRIRRRGRDGLLHRRPEADPVVAQDVRPTDRQPDRRPFLDRRLEGQRPLEELHSLVDGVSRDGELGGPDRPVPGLSAEGGEALRLARPGEIDVLRSDRLGVVMGERGRVLVAPVAVMLDALRIGGVEPGPPRRRQAVIGHIPGEGVLEGVPPGRPVGRARDTADEVPAPQRHEVRLGTAQQLDDRLGFEPAADRRPRPGAPSCRAGRADRALRRGAPWTESGTANEPAVSSSRHTLGPVGQDPALRQGHDELLQEEGVPLRPVDDEIAQDRRCRTIEERRDHSVGLGARQRIEPDRGGATVGRDPAGATPGDLRSGRRQDEERSVDLTSDPLEQVEERRLGPVDVLDEEDRRAFGDDLVEQRDPGVVQTGLRGHRVEVAGRVETHGQPEDRPGRRAARAPAPGGLTPDPELPAKDLGERPVGDPLAVRGTAADPDDRWRRAAANRPEPAPDEGRLADPGSPTTRDGPRLGFVDGPPECAVEGSQLVPAADEGPATPAGSGVGRLGRMQARRSVLPSRR